MHGRCKKVTREGPRMDGRASIALLKIRGLTYKMASPFGDFIEAKF